MDGIEAHIAVIPGKIAVFDHCRAVFSEFMQTEWLLGRIVIADWEQLCIVNSENTYDIIVRVPYSVFNDKEYSAEMLRLSTGL